MKPALLLSLLLLLARCGVMGSPVPYVDTHPETKPPEEEKQAK